MKKILLIALVGFSLSSCKKDYVCECSFSSNAYGFENSNTQKYDINKSSKKDAESKCDDYESGIKQSFQQQEVFFQFNPNINFTYSANCDLK